MIREFVTGMSMLEIHRWMRREKLRLVRLIPRTLPENGATEAYVVLYVKA